MFNKVIICRQIKFNENKNLNRIIVLQILHKTNTIDLETFVIFSCCCMQMTYSVKMNHRKRLQKKKYEAI